MSTEEVEKEQIDLFLEQFSTYESYLDNFVSKEDLEYLGETNQATWKPPGS